MSFSLTIIALELVESTNGFLLHLLIVYFFEYLNIVHEFV